MRKFVVAASLAVIGLVLLRPGESAAVRAPCFTGDERLALSPSGVVAVDGFIVQRSSATGRYQADGGLEFDVNAGVLSAVTAQGTCGMTSPTVSLKLSDPFSGVPFEVQAVLP
jgi:hypothetical protein